ncbi:AAA family ATPase [Streptomyces sp. 6N223]|uniref:AAA family ATPase n=1 Tax=Streptomyces sp. 6N223 TaxID=3457412 RepID=UPI003FD3BAEB
MIVWLNGTFGAGKTTTARELTSLLPESRIFDTEYVGYMLRLPLEGSVPVKDFQDWRPWRPLVVETARQLLNYVRGTLVIPQTVLVQRYWSEIHTGLSDAGLTVHHFVLHTDRDTLARRIEADADEPAAAEWRLAHLDTYDESLSWLSQQGQLIDTTHTPPPAVARTIARRLNVDPS